MKNFQRLVAASMVAALVLMTGCQNKKPKLSEENVSGAAIDQPVGANKPGYGTPGIHKMEKPPIIEHPPSTSKGANESTEDDGQ